ncbi:MAG: hypothetical protein K0S65_920, partial [Labilithrix sp.]|nr:hypothetical protein [Labilithrix sp.]
QGFTNATASFSDAGATEPATDPCPLVCSLDLRSVTRSCSGEVTQTCSPENGCAEGHCVPACDAVAAAKSSLGCEFYMQPPPTAMYWARSCYAAYVVNPWTLAAPLAFEHEGHPLDLTDSVFQFVPGSTSLSPLSGPLPPGEAAVVFLSNPPTMGQEEKYVACPAGVRPALDKWIVPVQSGLSTSIRLKSTTPISVTTIYPFGGAEGAFPSATLLLPVTSWGKQHVIVEPVGRMAKDTVSGRAAVPGAQIVAAEDDTHVTILPAKDIQGGPAVAPAVKGSPVTYALSRGQFVQLSQDDELSGSFVESDKPTSVFGGHACMFIPSDVYACDVSQTQLPSFEQWGNVYVGVRYRGRLSENEAALYRIVAAFDGTELAYDPEPPPDAPRTMKAGEVVGFSASRPFVLRSQDPEHPVFMAAYMTGGNNGGVNVGGDPEFVNVVPAGQYLNAYTFYADPTYEETSLVIVRQKSRGAFEEVELDCAGGTLDGFEPVGVGGEFEYRRVDLSRGGGHGEAFPGGTCTFGLHRLKSNGPVTATIWGWAPYASFGYPGGLAQRTLVTKPLVVR